MCARVRMQQRGAHRVFSCPNSEPVAHPALTFNLFNPSVVSAEPSSTYNNLYKNRGRPRCQKTPHAKVSLKKTMQLLVR